MQVDIQVKYGRCISCHISKAEEPTMSSRLRNIAVKIGISVGEHENKRLIEPASDFSGSIKKLYPKLFDALNSFAEKYTSFFDDKILQYKNQFLFYLNMYKFYDNLLKN
jgi:hypothetical protein